MVQAAKKRNQASLNASFIQARAQDLPFASSAFDAVLAMGVLEYIATPQVAIDEFARVVKPGGVVIVSMLNSKSPYRFLEHNMYWPLQDVRALIRRRAPWERLPLHLVEEHALIRSLENGGLRCEDCVYYDFNLLPPPLDSYFPRLSIKISSAMRGFGRAWLRRLGSGYVLKARRSAIGSSLPEHSRDALTHETKVSIPA
jgi:SAM-dependent methyltransferase